MKSAAQQALLLLFLALMLTSGIDAARFEGSISTDFETDMAYVGRFVYHPMGEAILDYDMKVPVTCFEKNDLVPGIQNSKILLSPGTGRPCYKEIDDDGSEIIHCKGQQSFITNRDWWYYITFMNCHYLRNIGINVRYKLHLLNGDGYWNREFSADESSMLETTLICGTILAVLLVVASIFRVQLASQRKLHTTYKIWFVSLITQFIGVVILTFALFNFAVDGYERSNTMLTGHIFTSVGNVIFTTVLILIGKGYTITRLDIRRLGVFKIIVFVVTYSTTFLTLYILKEKADKRDVKNIYDGEAAFGLVVLRFVGLGWILYGVFFTMKNYPKKRAFYLAFTTFAIVWFLSEPFIILLSNYHLPLYCRAKVVHGVYLFVAVIGHAMFLFLTRPSTTNTFFPFHLSTNKVGFQVTDDESFTTNSANSSNLSHTKYMVEKERALDYDHSVEKPSTVPTISESVSKQNVKVSNNIHDTPKPATLTHLQEVFRAIEEVDQSIEKERAAELAQKKKLEAIRGFKIGGNLGLQPELSEESISPSKEVTDVTSSARDSNNQVKSAAEKDTKIARAQSEDDSPSKEQTTKEEAAKIKAKQLEDIFVTSRHKNNKATDGKTNNPANTTVDTPHPSCKAQKKHLQSPSKPDTPTSSNTSSLTSEKGETKTMSDTSVQSLPNEHNIPSPTMGQGDTNNLQDYTTTVANVTTDPKIIVTKKNKIPRVKLHAYHEKRTSEELKELFVTSRKAQPTCNDPAQVITVQPVSVTKSFDEVTFPRVIPFKSDSDQDTGASSSSSSASTVSVNVKQNRNRYSTSVRGTDHRVNHSSVVRTFRPTAQEYRLQPGLHRVEENIKKYELQTVISSEDESSNEPEFESTVIQPATINTGLGDRFGCGQAGEEIPGQRWVEEHLLRELTAPRIPASNQLEVLPTAKNTHPTMNNQQRVPETESFARPSTQHHVRSNTVLRVENEMQQPSSHKTQHHQHSNGVVKSFNKVEQLSPARQITQHHGQSTTMLRVENEMEQLSSHKTKHHQHSNGVVIKTLNKVEQLPPACQSNQHRRLSNTVYKIENEMQQPSSVQQYVASTRRNFYAKHPAKPTYNKTKRELAGKEVDETPQSKEECLKRLRKLRDELAMAERLEQQTSLSSTTSESSLGSVPDEESGDSRKRKRRNPIHKARKMLGKKKHSEQGGKT